MISVLHFADERDFADRAAAALKTLGGCPGFVRGRLGRGIDDAADWVLVTEWDSVGAYRRALGSYAVKLHAAPLLGLARDEAGAFETLAELDADGPLRVPPSDREQA